MKRVYVVTYRLEYDFLILDGPCGNYWEVNRSTIFVCCGERTELISVEIGMLFQDGESCELL